MSGFDNEILNCQNVDFRGTSPVEPQMTSDGQLLIGSSTAPYIRASNLTSSAGSLQITNGEGTINVELSPTTQYNVQVGSASGGLTDIAPGPMGIPLVSQGATMDPSFSTAQVVGGGTGKTAFTTYAPVCGGTSTTGGLQSASSGISNTGYVLTSTGASSLPTWQAASGGGMSWTEVTDTSQSMAVGNGYILNNAGLVTATLPATAAVGDIVAVVGLGSGGWRIAQNAGDYIIIGSATASTTGVTGHIDSTNRYDCIELICVVANDGWVARSVVGNISIT